MSDSSSSSGRSGLPSAASAPREEVAHRFQPSSVHLLGRSFERLRDVACEFMGGRRPVHEWQSSDEPVWDRPPSFWMAW